MHGKLSPQPDGTMAGVPTALVHPCGAGPQRGHSEIFLQDSRVANLFHEVY